ncbi:MAG: hypothetical protein ACM3N9_04620 [Syntrophothermus sp.]
MKTQRKDQGRTVKTKGRSRDEYPRMNVGGFGEDEDYDPREADMGDDDDESVIKERDYDQRHRTNP